MKKFYTLTKKQFEKRAKENLTVAKIDGNKITSGDNKKKKEKENKING